MPYLLFPKPTRSTSTTWWPPEWNWTISASRIRRLSRPSLGKRVEARHGDAAKLTEKERKPLREQALIWLREEPAVHEKLAALPDAASREAAIQWFRHVKQDNDFAGVRDAKALAQFDEAERMQWQQFWQAVDAALKKAQKSPGGWIHGEPSLWTTQSSVHHVEGFILEEGHTAQHFSSDYCYNLIMSTLNEAGYEADKVYEHHLAMARLELDNFGIADPTTFDAKLRKVS